MYRFISLIIVGSVVSISGCDRLSDGGGGDPEAEFIAAYREAHEAKDVDGLLELYCWDDVPDDLRETIRGNVQDQVEQPIKEIRIDEAKEAQSDVTTEGQQQWRLNLTSSAELTVEFESVSGYSLTSITYLVGLKRGKYLIGVRVPAN